LLIRRSLYYKNVFDSALGMVRGRYINGNWIKQFNADKRETYITEGTPRQYTFYVPHDMAGLIQLMGGKQQLESALDALFIKNEYWHGNEPGHQIPFLYNYTNTPSKTQATVHAILNEEYSDGAGGLSGNDDAGQMSAWFVFASMGFYPVNPASDEYAVTASIFTETKINLPNGKCFIINSIKNHNERVTNKLILRHNTLMKGGRLTIVANNK